MSSQVRFYRALSCCLLVLLFLIPSTTTAQPHLRYFRLAEPPGGASRAHDVVVNESMIAVCGEVREDLLYRAAVWNGYLDLPIPNWIATELPGPDTTVASRAFACVLKDTSQMLICGAFDGGAEGQPKPIVWTLDPTETPDPTGANFVLPTLGGAGGSGEARSCSFTTFDDLYASVCAGWSRAPAGVQKAVVWLSDSEGSDFTIEPLLDYGPGLESRANVILDPCVCEIQDPCPCELYVAAGWAESPGGTIIPHLWPPNHKIELPLSPGYVEGVVVGFATALDLAGIVATGYVKDAVGNQVAAIWFQNSEDVWVNGVLDPIGVYSVSVASAGLIGDEGDDIFVGTSFNTLADRTATLWTNNATTHVYDLNSIITGPAPDIHLGVTSGMDGRELDGLRFVYICGTGVILPTEMALAPAALGDPHAYLVTNDLVLTAVVEAAPAYDPVRIVAYPNPCVDGTRFAYTLAKSSQVRLSVYDVAGRRVATLADGFREGGEHTLRWDGRRENGSELASGIYFARLEAGKQVATRKIVLLK